MSKCCETGPFTPYLEGLNGVYHQPSKKVIFLPSTVKMHSKIKDKKVSMYFKFRY